MLDGVMQSARHGEADITLDERYPLYPLNSPGLPVPGENFIAHAIELGDAPPVFTGRSAADRRLESWGKNLEYLYRRALYDASFTLPVATKSGRKLASLVPGHLFGADTAAGAAGPRHADIMIVGKMPGKEEVESRQNFVGPTSEVFIDALDEIGVGMERYEWYLDSLVHWPLLNEQSSTLPKAHIKDCDMLLQQTLRLVRPKYLLCLGSDTSKHLLGNAYGVQAMNGRMLQIHIPIHVWGESPQYHTINVMAATHPAAVFRTPELYPDMLAQLSLFLSMTNGAEIGKKEKGLRHVNVYQLDHLRQIVDEIRSDPDPMRRVIAVDGEWEGDNPGDDNAYLRTIQFSSKHGEGINVVLRHQGGSTAFVPSIGSAITELRRLLKHDPVSNYHPRVGGHFFRADLPFLIHEGLDLRDEYAPPEDSSECRVKGGFDTGLMYHAVNETASYRLTDMMIRLTSAPVYDARLKTHITDYCKQRDMRKEDLEGYGFLPSWILHPEPYEPEDGDNYAQYDPDVTRRIAIRHLDGGGLLDNDWNGNSSWEPYWRSHRASLGVLAMEMNGIALDRPRVDSLTVNFIEVRNRLLDAFRTAINWPTFNPESPLQCVAFLFGDRYGYKIDKNTNQRILIAPRDAMRLDLTPVKSTGKRSKLWEDVIAKGQEHAYSPSTDKEVLGILGHHNKYAMWLRDLKFITQVLKGPLRPPSRTDEMAYETDADGNFCYDKGLAACAAADGRVHTHISQNKETGRGSSARPPLQNISKRREGDYSRIQGIELPDKETGIITCKGDYLDLLGRPYYIAPIRTIFRAADGYVLVEADYTGAELAGIAWLSGDQNMIEHVRRNILPESHPDHYDIHSHTAVDTFQLSCPPSKKGLKEAGYAPLRVAAKNVNFGIPYGRSAEAIARQCKEEGTEVSIEDCQAMIDAYFTRYPKTGQFLAECRRRSQEDRWVAGSFGRMRRFIPTRDRSVIGEQQRQAQNFPIQNLVADAIWQAIYNFWKFKQNNNCGFRLLLQIHDALLFEVPISELRYFLENVMRQCMIDQVPIWPRFLDNTPMPVDSPYYFGIDHDVQINWGEKITKKQAIEHGIDFELI